MYAISGAKDLYATTAVTRHLFMYACIHNTQDTSLCMQYQVRKIFTLRQPLQDTSPDIEDYPELVLESHLRETEQADILKSLFVF
jgi:hypothetical protein